MAEQLFGGERDEGCTQRIQDAQLLDAEVNTDLVWAEAVKAHESAPQACAAAMPAFDPSAARATVVAVVLPRRGLLAIRAVLPIVEDWRGNESGARDDGASR